MLTDEYIAGFMDGEGTFSLFSGKHYTKSGEMRPYPVVKVCVANTYLPVIEMIRKKYGGHLSEDKWNTKATKPIYRLQFRYDEMGLFLPNILPHLVEKRERAQRVLDFLEGRNV